MFSHPGTPHFLYLPAVLSVGEESIQLCYFNCIDFDPLRIYYIFKFVSFNTPSTPPEIYIIFVYFPFVYLVF